MKIKRTKIAIKILMCIPALVILFFINMWILPQIEIDDEIVAYGIISVSNGNKHKTKEVIVYKFFTLRGYELSVKKAFITENKVTLKYSCLFRSITSVKSQTKDYSNFLISNLNMACIYFTAGLTIVATISIFILRFDKKLSENSFQNIILLNSFLTMCTLFVFAIYN